MSSLLILPYFHGTIDIRECREALTSIGDFLVRNHTKTVDTKFDECPAILTIAIPVDQSSEKELVGLTVIALTLWIRFDKSFESEIRENILRDTDPEPLAGVKADIRTGILVAFWIIIGFSIANVIIGFVGVVGAFIRSRYLLAPYLLSMIILFLLEIAVGITALVKRKSIRRTVKEYVFDSFNMNSQPDISAFSFRYNCCGADNLTNLNCFAGQPTCSSAVWDRLDFTMMIFGICMLVIVVLQAFTALITVPVVIERKREVSY
uniref:Tetraspanin n=1 Tax=Caenorhabditis tropicalis TaxID=1561998 RepID=A0A1I7U4C1_9PELO